MWMNRQHSEVLRVLGRWLLLAVVLGAAAVTADQLPVVRTRQGAVRGRHQNSSNGRQFCAFYNLPYAKPPVGDLRFKEPHRPDEWPHIRDATAPGSFCVQYGNMFYDTGVFGSEDCLYLNVFTPKLSVSSLLPVMIWIHGGAFTYGGANNYGPDFLLNHDVVLVTINYRLGPFGFLSTEDEAAPGNFGLKDQVAALRWVHENIAAFGGDPGKVTVFGQSAGALNTHLLALSPLTKGLIHRVIMQSGTGFGTSAVSSKGVAAEKARKIAAKLGCPTSSSAAMVDCLRSIDDHVLSDSMNFLDKWYGHPVIKLQPVIEGESDGAFLPKNPLHLKPNNAQWMIGMCQDEGALITASMYTTPELIRLLQEDFLEVFPITAFYENAPNKDDLTQKIRNFYMPSGNVSLRPLTDLYADVYFLWTTDRTVRQYKNMSPVFLYVLSYKGKYSAADPLVTTENNYGVGHTDDLFYLFPKNPFYPKNYDLPKEDMEVVYTMTKLWTNFARNGNPTPGGVPLVWPTVTSDDDQEYLDIGKNLTIKKGFAKERMLFGRSLSFIDEAAVGSLKDEL